MKQRLTRTAAFAALMLVMATALSHRTSGQQASSQPARAQVTLVRVKPDMIDAWIDFQAKRTVPALKKAGVIQRDVYQAAYGNLGEFRVVTPIDKFADRDNPSPIERALGVAGAKEYNDTLRKMIATSTTSVVLRLQDLQFDPKPDAVYKLLVLSTVHVLPGHVTEYLDFLQNEILPVEKKGETKRMIVSRVALGGDGNEIRVARFAEKFADLDAGPATVRVLGPDGARKLGQKTDGIVASTQATVYVRNETLSFRIRSQS
jgi:hypothetical protein